ncbi:MAG TPA: LysE family transporter [Sedimentisphaerales bacterium]|nr:LysE family transporter [Sedimentisphaerales bacterium]
MNLLFFLVQVFVISFSGAMQPGPVTATVITMGARNRYAGALLAVGHGIIEFPLMILIILGMGKLLRLEKTQVVIGLAGGAFLLIMAVQMFIRLNADKPAQNKPLRDRPVLAGIILSASNPYFLIWWATVGLALATQAVKWGVWAFVLFAVAHWSVDLIWLQVLSWASFKGSRVFGPRGRRTVILICVLALLAFGLFFIYAAVAKLLRLV